MARRWSARPPGDDPESESDEPILSSLDETTPASSPPHVGLTRWRWGLRLGALVAAAVLVALLAPSLTYLVPLPPAAPLPPDYTTLALSPDIGFCGSDGFWSPDGRRIAIVKATASCGASVTPQPDVFIYDAATGAQTATYRMMPAIEDALALRSMAGAALNLLDAVWSPNQRTLAVIFAAQPEVFSGPALQVRAGVALLTLSGQRRGAVATVISAQDLPQTIATNPQLVDEWDTFTLTGRRIALPLALAYQWLPTDDLVAANPVSGAAPGNPIGGRRFSMWRRGFISAINTVNCQGGTVRDAAGPFTLIDLRTAAWSPDGRYLLSLTMLRRAPGAPVPSVLAPRPLCVAGPLDSALPATPAPDRAMSAALALLGGGVTQVDLMWSLDGARLAALPFGVGELPSAVIIYDTASGAVLARLSAGSSGIPGAQGSDADAQISDGSWSPDGHHFLTVIQAQQFTMRVYSPSALA